MELSQNQFETADRLARCVAYGRNNISQEDMKSFMEGLSEEERALFREKASSLTMEYLEARGLAEEGSGEFIGKSMNWYLGNRSLGNAMREYGGLLSLYDEPKAAVMIDPEQNLFLLDKEKNEAIKVDLCSKQVLAKVNSYGDLDGVHEAIGRLAYDRFLDIPQGVSSYLEQNLRDVSNCVSMNHQMTPDGNFILLQNPLDSLMYNVASNIIDSPRFGQKLLERECMQPELSEGVLKFTGKAQDVEISEKAGREDIQVRQTSIIKYLAKERVYGHLQSDNTDWESRNQLAGYAERVGVTLRPGEMKSLVQDFMKVEFREAEEDFTEQLSRSRGMSR